MQDNEPISYDEFKKRMIDLFLERGNKKEDMWYLTEDLKNFKRKYETRCEMFKNGNLNAFSYENLIGHVKSTEDNIRMDNTEYPMSYEQFKNRVIELFLETGDREDKIKFLNELLEEDPCYIKNSYRDTCSDYERKVIDPPEKVFEDYLLPVRDLEMLY